VFGSTVLYYISTIVVSVSLPSSTQNLFPCWRCVVLYYNFFVRTMSLNEDYDREGRDEEGHCTVCGVSFRGRRGLSAHLGRSQQCSASSVVYLVTMKPPCRWSVDSFPNTRRKE
jgi:hypothetical protein